MFEQATQKPRSAVWRFLPLALTVFLVIVVAAIYVSSLDSNEVEELTGILRKGHPDYDWYRKYVELTDPKLQMGLNFAGNRVVMLSGVIHNDGERTLDVVELKVVLFNYEEPVWEAARAPIRPGPYTPPVPPLTKRSFVFYIEKIPEDWKSSHAEMSISGLRFVPRPRPK